MAISENELIIPALTAMYNAPSRRILTSDLINEISNNFILDNQDLTPLLNRNDEKYTQIVRNLKSHKTLAKLNFATEFDGGFELTDEGANFLETNGFV